MSFFSPYTELFGNGASPNAHGAQMRLGCDRRGMQFPGEAGGDDTDA
ncbi:hypothetical protein [Xanthomonas hortorum]|nr:hypothetical protein [Xanthomonas hortorum pv. hederae]